MNNNKIKVNYWLITLIIFPLVFFFRFSDFFEVEGVTKVLISAALGGLGGVLGFGVYSLVKVKTIKVKTLATLSVVLIGVGGLLLLNSFTKQEFETCEICGYIAVDVEELACEYCGEPTWEIVQKFGVFSTKEEWMKEEQLFWFALDNESEQFSFYEPIEDEGYKKDINWKPVITQLDLVNDYYEYGASD